MIYLLLLLGTWSEQIVVPEDSVLRAPEGLPLEISASLLHSAGIAYRLLNDFVTLQPGDFVMQNDASSPVGMAIIQLCKARGIKTINIVKDWYPVYIINYLIVVNILKCSVA